MCIYSEGIKKHKGLHPGWISEDRQWGLGFVLKLSEDLHETLCLNGPQTAIVWSLQLVPQMDHLGRHICDTVFQDLEFIEGILQWKNYTAVKKCVA